ncbi:hypothetical protein ACFL0U_03960 [Pseudomonadota bacterium]
MLNLHKIAERQLRDQIKMGFFVLDKDSEAEGKQKNIEEHKDNMKKDLLDEIESKKLKVTFIKSNEYNEKICEAIAEEFVKKLPGTNRNKIQELKYLIAEALMTKSYELEHKIHSLRTVEDVQKFTDNLFYKFELIDQKLRDGRFLRETNKRLTIRFSDKSARHYQNRNKKNLTEARIGDFKRIIYGAALDVNV